MRLLLFLLLSCCCSALAQAQPYFTEQEEFLNGNRNWVFGSNAGITFNATGGTTAFSSAYSTMAGAGSAAVSDRNTGQLLFYSDGVSCWDNTHQLMPNGNNLSGTNTGTYFVTTQGVCIIPMIGNEDEYYLFYLNLDSGTPVLYYSVVDMTLNNGLGDIDPTRKDILVHDDKSNFGESIIAVPGDNCDIWLLSYAFEKSEFKSYHITEKGLDKTPVISSGGQAVQSKKAYEYGTLAISPDRSMIAFTDARSFSNKAPDDIDGVFIGKFDPSTGQIADVIKFNDEEYVGGYGLVFSPDNSKLYSFTAGIEYFNQVLVQFDVSTFDSTAIITSKQTIPSPVGMFLDQSLRAYGDTIYVSDFFSISETLGAITAPNLQGAACNYIGDVVPFAPGTNVNWGMGNNVVYSLKDTIASLIDTFVCANASLTIASGSSEAFDFIWSDGSTASSKTIEEAGTYWVSYQENSCTRRIDTFVVEKIELSPEINVNVLILGTTLSYSTYQWMLDGELIPEATDSLLEVSKNGNYQVIVSDENGCIDTSAIYKVTNAEPDNIQDVNGLSNQITIYPNPASGRVQVLSPVEILFSLHGIEGRIVKPLQSGKQLDLEGLTGGIYFLRIYDKNHRLIKVEKIVKK